VGKLCIPPIKSQGIKTKLVPWILETLPDKGGRWIDPFLGTGVVAFNSGFEKALLSDSNPHIINLYREIQNGKVTPAIVREYLEKEGDQLSREGYAHYRVVKSRFNKDFSPLDFLFLSRAGFNGMMRFNRRGEWNIPFCKKPDRFVPGYISKVVNQVARVTNIIQQEPHWVFLNQPFSQIIPLAEEGDIIYCDPPYYGRYADYYNAWTEEDEASLFHLLRETKARFVLSTWHHNDWRENQMVGKFWSRFNVQTRDHFYHSGAKIENRRKIVEALVYNF
jgi:DNA adenine methylase